MQPTHIEHDSQNPDSEDLFSATQNRELVKILDEQILPEYRENYLKLKHGIKISKNNLTKLQNHIKEIMENYQWKTAKRLENEDN